MARKKKVSKKDYISFGVEKWEKDAFREEAKSRNMSMSGMGRIMLDQFRDDGCNEPIVMCQLVELTQQINDLEGKIPKDEYNDIQKTIGKIMKIKGGK